MLHAKGSRRERILVYLTLYTHRAAASCLQIQVSLIPVSLNIFNSSCSCTDMLIPAMLAGMGVTQEAYISGEQLEFQ